MKFFEVGQPSAALVCAKDKEACRAAYIDALVKIANEPMFIADCHEIKFGQMLRETSDVIDEKTSQRLGLNEAANQLFASVFQQQAIVFWKNKNKIVTQRRAGKHGSKKRKQTSGSDVGTAASRTTKPTR